MCSSWRLASGLVPAVALTRVSCLGLAATEVQATVRPTSLTCLRALPQRLNARMCVQRQLGFDPGAGVPRGPFGKPHAARGRRLRGDRAHGGRTVPVLEFSLAEYTSTPELRGTAAARLPHGLNVVGPYIIT